MMRDEENEEQGTISGWINGRLPDDWFTGPAEVVVDREEITIIGTIAEPDLGEVEESDAAAKAEAARGRIARLRAETRDDRIAVARQAERRFDRKIAWGV